MKLSGTFLDINDTPIEVVIENKSITTSNIVIGCAGDDCNVFFSDDPLTVDEDYDSTFDVMVQKSGQLTLLTKGDTNLVGVLFANNQHNVTITINKNGDCVFYGFVEPNVYSQDYAEEYTELDINFTDFLSTLQYGKLSDASTYNEAKQAASTLSFKDYIEAMGFFNVGNVYFDKSSKVGDTEIDSLSGIGVSGSLFFGDTEDDEWTFEDILKEILQYLNLHIIQIGTDFYIFDWSTLKDGRTEDTKTFLCLNSNTDEEIYFPQKSYRITQPDYASNDTQISVDEVYNQIQVKCDLKDLETIVESPLDSEKLVSLYPKRFLYCTEYAVKKKNNNPILSMDVGDFNNIIHGQSVDNDNAHKYDWYMRPLLNNSWKFYLNKSVDDSTIESTYPSEWIDGQGSVYSMPWKVTDYLKHNALTPCMFNMAYIDTLGKNVSDNNIKNDFDDNSNYLYISINGNGDDTEAGHKPSDDDIKAHSGMIEYQPSNSAVILSPTDDTSTNYLVFSGKISLQPLTYDSIGKTNTGDFINYGTLMDKGGYAKSCYPIGFKGGNGDKHGEEEINEWYQYTRKWYNNDGYFYTNSLSPYVQERSPWKYKYNYTSSGDRSDKFMKLPILECEMTVGNKRLIETNIDQYGNSTFKWVKIGEEPKGIDNEPITTFSLGVNPKIGDCIIGTEFDLQNTIDPFMNIDGSGTAIPIKASDKLSGKITFKILGPINLTWNNVTRRHPSFWRHTKWTEGTVFVLAHTENIVLKDFECKIKTSSDIIMNKTDNDLIYMSDETKKYIKKNDSTEMKINTLLTTQEAYELGVSNSVNLSTAIDMSTSMPLKAIQKKEKDKPEQLYVDAYWNEYNKQRMLIDTTFKTTDFGDTLEWRFRPIKFNYFDGGFYPISSKINYKNDQTTMKLKEGASLSKEFNIKYEMNPYFERDFIELDVTKDKFYQRLFGAPRFARIRWFSSDESIAVVDDKGNVTIKGNGNVRIYANVSAKNYSDKLVDYGMEITNMPSEEDLDLKDVIYWSCYDRWQETKNVKNSIVSDADKQYIVVTNRDGDIYTKPATWFVGTNKFATLMDEGELLLDIDPENYTYFTSDPSTGTASTYVPDQYKMYKIKDVKMTSHNHVFCEPIFTKNKDNPTTYDYNASWYKLTSLDIYNANTRYGSCGKYRTNYPNKNDDYGMFSSYMWKEGIDNCKLIVIDAAGWGYLDKEYTALTNTFNGALTNTFNGIPPFYSDSNYAFLPYNRYYDKDLKSNVDYLNLIGTFAFTHKTEYDLRRLLSNKDYITLEGTFEGCAKLKTITLGDHTLSRRLGDKVFKDCTNLKTINNLNNYHPYVNNKVDQTYPYNRYSNCDYLFYGCKNLRIESYYQHNIIGPLLKYYFSDGKRPDKEFRVGKFAFGYCDFNNVGNWVNLVSDREDHLGNRYLYTDSFFAYSNIKTFIYSTFSMTTAYDGALHPCKINRMFMYTPIETCNLTGAGTLILRPTSDGQGEWCTSAFEGCDKLKVLRIDSVDGHTGDENDPYELSEDDKRIFKDCTSLQTVIINVEKDCIVSNPERQIDVVKSYLSKCGLNVDNINVRFKILSDQ